MKVYTIHTSGGPMGRQQAVVEADTPEEALTIAHKALDTNRALIVKSVRVTKDKAK